MEQLRFEAFLKTLDNDEVEGINLVVQNFMDLFPGKNFVDALDEPVLDELFKRYDELNKQRQLNQEHLCLGACILE